MQKKRLKNLHEMKLNSKTHKNFMKQLRYRPAKSYIKEIDKVIHLIQNNKFNSHTFRDHGLSGIWLGWRESHPLFNINKDEDLILVYRHCDKQIHFACIGTHKEVFADNNSI